MIQLIIQNHPVHMLIHDPVSIDDHIREDFFSRQNTKDTASDRSEKGIENIFSGNGALAVAQCFQRTDLCPFFFYHSGHRREADQSRYQEKQYRENGTQTLHLIGIIRITGVVCHIVPVRDRPRGKFQRCQICFRLSDLVFAFSNLIFCFLLGLFIIFPAVCKLCLIFFYGFFRFCKFGFFCLQLLFSFGKLLSCFCDLCFTRLDLRRASSKLCLCRLQLFFLLIQGRFLLIQLCPCF